MRVGYPTDCLTLPSSSFFFSSVVYFLNHFENLSYGDILSNVQIFTPRCWLDLVTLVEELLFADKAGEGEGDEGVDGYEGLRTVVQSELTPTGHSAPHSCSSLEPSL